MSSLTISLSRYVDSKNQGWIEVFADKYLFLTNGRKLYRCSDAIEKRKELHSLDIVEYDKCNVDKIIRQLKKYHPKTNEFEMLKQMDLEWLFVGIYTPFGRELIRYFFTKEQPRVFYGKGTTHLNDEYVSYSTVHLNGLFGCPTYDSLMTDTEKLNRFVRRELEANSFA